MARTHYETLGVSRQATSEEIRRSYRQLALKLHPDRNHAANAGTEFARIAEAYAVLSDEGARQTYDRRLKAAEPPPAPPKTPPPPNPTRVVPNAPAPELARLAVLFSTGQLDNAETLARRILEQNPREAKAYAVLGDIARVRGERNHAINLYAQAVQMDPRNSSHQSRYEELVNQPVQVPQTAAEATQRGFWASATVFFVTVVAAVYLALSREQPVVLTLTAGALGMLFLVGFAVGFGFRFVGTLERTNVVLGRFSVPGLSLGIGLLNFWVGLLLYVLLAFFQGASNPSVSRIYGGLAAGLFFLTLGATISPVLNALHVLVGGGGVMIFGCLLGWGVADAIRE
jgi:tetratricopeptide (TPR) repeat protein